MNPHLINRESIPQVLEMIGKDIEDLMNTFLVSHTTFIKVVQELYSTHSQLWVLPDEALQIQGWVITRIETVAGTTRLILNLFGGRDADLLLTKLPLLEEWSKEYGVTEVMAYARPGLRKKLKKDGFHHVCDLIVKPLTGIN